MISLTFDDGWYNQYLEGKPILDEMGFKGTFYVITQMPKYMLSEGQGRMTQDQWIELSNEGHEIGAHSRTHPHLQFCLPHKVVNEVVGSKKDLLRIGINPETFAYPYGRRNFFVDSIVRKNYKAGRLADGGSIDLTQKIKKESLVSICIIAKDSLETIKKYIDTSLRENIWTILVFHQIEENPPEWGCSPKMLRDICLYIKEKGVKVDLIKNVINNMNA